MKFIAAFAVLLSLSLISCEIEPDEFDDGVTVEEEVVSYNELSFLLIHIINYLHL